MGVHSSAVEQPAHNRSVPGSNPGGPTSLCFFLMEKRAEIIRFLEELFPAYLALPGDPTGLQVKSSKREVNRVLVGLELNQELFHRALVVQPELLYLHHPPLWNPIQTIDADHPFQSRVLSLYQAGVSILAHHTNLDCSRGGIADQWLKLLKIKGDAEPIIPHPGQLKYKIVTFVPQTERASLLRGIFSAGGGIIGDYRDCSFTTGGYGTFTPQKGALPFIGEIGKPQEVEEARVEVTVPADKINSVIQSIRLNHPYQEPVVDLYPLSSPSEHGLGRMVTLSPPLSAKEIFDRLSCLIGENLSVTLPPKQSLTDIEYQKIAICPGSGKGMVKEVIQKKAQAFISGDLSHHDVENLKDWGISYYHLPHGEGERKAMQAIFQLIVQKAKEQKLQVEWKWERE
ncbi:MAG: hypothetical protein PWP04_660 [Candidatus Atribacteria bacterium]|nr:hypothetical protein [Candidatus Atribacteria bacterium]